MHVKPVLLTEAIKQSLQPSMDTGNCTWEEIERDLANKAACVWQVGEQAWLITCVNVDDEVEILLCGGRGAFAVAGPFEAAMKALPAHKGMTLRIAGRKAWRRIFKHWDCKQEGGQFIMTSKV